MTLGAGSRSQESTVISHRTHHSITFEWDLVGLNKIYESPSDDEKSNLIASDPFGGSRWQLHFYACSGHGPSGSLFIAAVPTAEELRLGAAEADWIRRGPFSFTIEVKSLDGAVPIVARGHYEPMTRWEVSSNTPNWGYPQYVSRDEQYENRDIAKADKGIKIVCTMTYPLDPLLADATAAEAGDELARNHLVVATPGLGFGFCNGPRLIHHLDGHDIIRHSHTPFNTSGGFCDVFTGNHPLHGKVATKRPRMENDGCTLAQIKNFRTEAMIWKRLQHRHILQFIGITQSDGHLWLVSSFSINGSLPQYLSSHPTSIGLKWSLSVVAVRSVGWRTLRVSSRTLRTAIDHRRNPKSRHLTSRTLDSGMSRVFAGPRILCNGRAWTRYLNVLSSASSRHACFRYTNVKCSPSSLQMMLHRRRLLQPGTKLTKHLNCQHPPSLDTSTWLPILSSPLQGSPFL